MLSDFVIAGIFGSFIGAVELLSRYRDAPFRAAASASAITYIALNVIASTGTLWLVRVFGVTFGLDSDPERLRWAQVFSAGFGSMALLRSSFFILNVGDQTVSIGPSSVLDALLGVLDREVDRRRAQDRAVAIAKIMDGISFKKGQEQLPIVAFALMQNLSRDEQDRVINKVFGLEKQAGVSDKVKAQALGLALMDIVGEKVLRVAVDSIREEILATPLTEEVLESVTFTLDEEPNMP